MSGDTVKATKYIAYLRKSTDDKEKQTLSLESQAEVVRRLKEKYGITIVETIEEKQSAKLPGRHGFNRMIQMIQKGSADGIVTWQISRLSRNMVDAGQIMHLLDTRLLKTVITDQTTYSKESMELFMFGLQSLTAKLENDKTAYNVTIGMETCARKGIYPSNPPLGYLADKYGIRGARKREIDPVRFPLVQRMWQMMLEGTHTPSQILAKATNEWGLRTKNGKNLSHSMIYHMFNNPFYYGEFEWPKNSGKWYKGTHQPMVTKEQFDRVQQLLGKTGRSRPIKHYFAYGGCILHCSECNCAITGYHKTKTQKNGNTHNYTYYACTKRKGIPCSQVPVTESSLESDIEKVLSQIQIPETIHGILMNWVKEENRRQFEHIYQQNDANKQAYEVILKRIAVLIDMRMSEIISEAQFLEKKIEAEKERERIFELIKNTDEHVTNWIDTANKMFTFAELAVKRFKEGNEEVKRGILNSLGWNLSIKDKKLDISKEKWIEPVKKIAKVLQQELPRLEPFLALQNKEKIENLLRTPMMCTLLDDVRTSFVNELAGKWFIVVEQWKREINVLQIAA